MKGQFMMISAVIAGLITISAASTIATATASSFEPDQDSSRIYQIKSEAEEFDFSKQDDREAFREMVRMYKGLRVDTRYGSVNDCMNATVSSSNGEYELTCLKGR
ncbi:hypothetical protein [Candidatus Nanohalococcus occultus]|uniref:Uncharacterized protein n=1 Tax=Candidatus Nanohalococcus occultus TaxID=2978047 RepID=A0ABY8CH58_9ARCH|nr:hypothetical protein SVXNc_0833 [Candidatus Nanohaloarchaeota archaeon SVXNc]